MDKIENKGKLNFSIPTQIVRLFSIYTISLSVMQTVLINIEFNYFNNNFLYLYLLLQLIFMVCTYIEILPNNFIIISLLSLTTIIYFVVVEASYYNSYILLLTVILFVFIISLFIFQIRHVTWLILVIVGIILTLGLLLILLVKLNIFPKFMGGRVLLYMLHLLPLIVCVITMFNFKKILHLREEKETRNKFFDKIHPFQGKIGGGMIILLVMYIISYYGTLSGRSLILSTMSLSVYNFIFYMIFYIFSPKKNKQWCTMTTNKVLLNIAIIFMIVSLITVRRYMVWDVGLYLAMNALYINTLRYSWF